VGGEKYLSTLVKTEELVRQELGGLLEKYNHREFRLKKIGSDASCLVERLCSTVSEH